MVKDLNKRIFNIKYNHLNLPTKVEFEDVNDLRNGSKYIAYTYDATGVKLKKTIKPGTSLDGNVNLISLQYEYVEYDNGFIYEYLGTTTPELKFFVHAEGYVEPDGKFFLYLPI